MTTFKRSAILAAVVAGTMAASAAQANIYWDGPSASWNVAANWSTVNSATTPDPVAPPGAGDIAQFNIAGVNAATTVTLDAPQAALGLVYSSTGPVTIATGVGINTLSLGTSGITINAGSGADTISAGVILAAPQTWTSNASTTLTISGAISDVTGNALTISSGATTTFSAADTFTGPLTVIGGNLQVNGTAGILNGTTSLTVTGLTTANASTGVFTDGSATASQNNGFTSGRLTPGASLTLGGSGKGGVFFMFGSATGNTAVSQTLGAITNNSGGNTIAASSGSFSVSNLTLAGGANGYVRTQAGGVLTLSKIGLSSAVNGTAVSPGGSVALNISFANAPTGAAISGTGSSAVLVGAFAGDIGAIGAGASMDLIAANAGAPTKPTYTGTWSANSNTAVAGAPTVPAGTPTNALVFNSSPGPVTITAADTAVINSGMILTNSGIGANGTSITGGKLTSGNGYDLIFAEYAIGSGSNTISSIITDNGSTSIGLTKFQSFNAASSGALILTATNTYTGPTTIDGTGSIQLNNSNAIAASSGVVANTTTALTFGSSVTSATIQGLSGPGGIALKNINTTVTAVNLNVGFNNASSTYGGSLSSSGSLTKIGTGTLTLQGASSYTGATNISAGTLKLNGGTVNSSIAYVVSPSATFDLGGSTLNLNGATTATAKTLSGGGTVVGTVNVAALNTVSPGISNVGTLTTNDMAFTSTVSTSPAKVNVWLGNADGSNPLTVSGIGGLVMVNGNLTFPSFAGAVNVTINDAGVTTGAPNGGLYDLFSYTGTLTGFNGGALGAGTFALTNNTGGLSGRTFSFINDTANKQIELQIAAAPISLTWTGLQADNTTPNSSWDTTTTSTNWANGATASFYADPNSVTFNDTSAINGSPITNTSVVIQAAGVNPAIVTFNNNAVNYTLSNASGPVGIAGSTDLNKNGTGTVFLQSPNTFTGKVKINAGAVDIADSNAVGSSSGIIVASGGALQLRGGITQSTVPITLNGTGVTAAPAGAISNMVGTNTIASPITLASASAIGSNSVGDTLNLTGGIVNGGFAVTINGAGNTTINGATVSGTGGLIYAGTGTLTLATSNSYSGGTTLASGTTNVSNDNELGAVPGSVSASNIKFTGNATLQAGAGLTLGTTRGVSISAGKLATIDTNGNAMTINGPVSGGDASSAINKVGSGTLSLTASNSFAGGVVINAGTVSTTAAKGLGSGPVTLTGTAPTLQLVATNPTAGGSVSNFPNAVSNKAGGGPINFVDANNTLHITTQAGVGVYQNQAEWNASPVSYANGFTASFLYTDVSLDLSNSGLPSGGTFTLQNQGTNALGGYGAGLGYSGVTGQGAAITTSIAFGWNASFNTVQGGVNGNLLTATTIGNGISLGSHDPILFTLQAGGGSSNSISYTLTDTVTTQSFSGTVSLGTTLNAALGNGGNALVGFTGGTTNQPTVSGEQTIASFSYLNGSTGTFTVGNNVVVSTDSTIDVDYNTGAALGGLTMGTNTLNIINSGGGGTNLSFTSASLSGSPTIAIPSATKLTLGTVTGTTPTITLNAPDSTDELDVAALPAGTNLNIGSAGKFKLTANATPHALNQLASFTFPAGASLSFANNDVVITNGSSQLAAVTQALGVIGTPSGAVAITTTGEMTGADWNARHPAGSLDGITPGATDLVLRFAYAGDANLDGNITVSDYTALDAGFLLGLTPTWDDGDFNHDGVIDYQDYALIDFNYVNGGTNPLAAEAMVNRHAAEFGAAYSTYFAGLSAPVPEPTTLGLLAIGAMGLLARRRK